MPRQKSATDLDAKLTASLEKAYENLAQYVDGFDFANEVGGNIRKFVIAVEALEGRTKSAVGEDDRLTSFYKRFLEEEDDRAFQRTKKSTTKMAEETDAEESALDETLAAGSDISGVDDAVSVDPLDDIEEEDAVESAVQKAERELVERVMAREAKR